MFILFSFVCAFITWCWVGFDGWLRWLGLLIGFVGWFYGFGVLFWFVSVLLWFLCLFGFLGGFDWGGLVGVVMIGWLWLLGSCWFVCLL